MESIYGYPLAKNIHYKMLKKEVFVICFIAIRFPKNLCFFERTKQQLIYAIIQRGSCFIIKFLKLQLRNTRTHSMGFAKPTTHMNHTFAFSHILPK